MRIQTSPLRYLGHCARSFTQLPRNSKQEEARVFPLKTEPSGDASYAKQKKRKWLDTSDEASPKPRSGADSKQPQDLESFLIAARERAINPSSTYFVGTRYEFQVLDFFKSYRFKLTRRGAAYDEGFASPPFGSNKLTRTTKGWILKACGNYQIRPLAS